MTRATPEPVLLARLDAFTETIGRSIAWLVMAMMLLQFTIVVMRYLFSVHSTVMQESVMYMHAMVFMLAAAYTLKHDRHVRVDVFHRQLSPRSRAWIDLLGTLLLLVPVMLFLGLGSLGYVASSWAILERSADGGLPAVFLLKTLIPLMCLLLLLQSVAQVWRNILIIRGRLPAVPTDKHGEDA